MTTTSPGRICRWATASAASSSESKTRAWPRCRSFLTPLVFITQPSGDRFPFRPTIVPVASRGDGILEGLTAQDIPRLDVFGQQAQSRLPRAAAYLLALGRHRRNRGAE